VAGVSSSPGRVQDALALGGVDARVVDLPESTRTARDAAAAIGCELGQIAKSMVFVNAAGEGVIVLAPGDSDVAGDLVAGLVHQAVRMATPKEVRRLTGFAIGGVSPVGHATAIPVIMDERLLTFPQVWAAAGTPRSVFGIAPADLERITGARVASVSRLQRV
jgi:prolyl-tRNA editing enzyme YbaK/EbsC (Cys-tRNA(Pro) deacylase)